MVEPAGLLNYNFSVLLCEQLKLPVSNSRLSSDEIRDGFLIDGPNVTHTVNIELRLQRHSCWSVQRYSRSKRHCDVYFLAWKFDEPAARSTRVSVF